MAGSPSAGIAAIQRAHDERTEQARALVGRSLAGRWTLTKLIGVGGMASVYEAKHRNGRTAAVKLLHPHVLSQPSARRRFLSEGYASNKVDHPGVVLVLDDGEDGELVFLVMELLRGRSLAERLASEGPLPAAFVVKAMVAVLDALAAAHDRGVVHRDVKPSNVFELYTGEIKVLDFGVAQVRDPETVQVTESGVALGTPAFMAPEQAAGRTDEVDALTDIWSVGATMFQLLTGALVHDAQSPNAAIVAAATTPARSVQSLRPDVPDAVARVVDRALAFHRRDRWPNARAMRRALLGEGAAGDGLVGAATVPDVVVTKPKRQRKRAGWRAAAVALALGAAAYAFLRSTSEPSPSRSEPSPASPPLAVAREPSTPAPAVAPQTKPPPATSVAAAASPSPSAPTLAPAGASMRRSPPGAPTVRGAKRRTSSTSSDDSSLIETRQ